MGSHTWRRAWGNNRWTPLGIAWDVPRKIAIRSGNDNGFHILGRSHFGKLLITEDKCRKNLTLLLTIYMRNISCLSGCFVASLTFLHLGHLRSFLISSRLRLVRIETLCLKLGNRCITEARSARCDADSSKFLKIMGVQCRSIVKML